MSDELLPGEFEAPPIQTSIITKPHRHMFIQWTAAGNRVCNLRKAFDGEDKKLTTEQLIEWKRDYAATRKMLDDLYTKSIEQIIKSQK